MCPLRRQRHPLEAPQSPAFAPLLEERDRQAVIEALRRLAAIERAKRRHTAGGR